jgi:tRNA (guanine37-N1)-methyltransferase
MVDAVVRLLPGAVGDEESVDVDSFSRSLLDFPHFTRPAEYRGWRVPDVLLSGNHAEIRRWRMREALSRTLALRPDLLPTADLDSEEREILRVLMEERGAEHGRD